MARARLPALALFAVVVALVAVSSASAFTPLDVHLDALLRMPGTQPSGTIVFQSAASCTCHFNYSVNFPPEEPGFNWQGSMMSQSARDPLFFASMVVAAQDSIWALGNPNAVDACERCHFPMGWLGDRSAPTNAVNFTGSDYEGVSCDLCHRMYDPFFQATYSGAREGTSPEGIYWDEATAASHTALAATLLLDQAESANVMRFNNTPFFDVTTHLPPSGYTENGAGQLFVSAAASYRASFSDAVAPHGASYSRYHKSRYYCGSCHDISNPVMANLGANPGNPLPTETQSAFSYNHLERTFSEFALSAYGQPGGAAGIGPFAPGTFNTSQPGDRIAACQDCHMRDVAGTGASTGVMRPTGSSEHPNSGLPLHNLTGGGTWIASVLASTIVAQPSYDATNAQLLGQGPTVLTLDLTQGMPLNWTALQSGSGRAVQQLQLAAEVQNVHYDRFSGALTFRIQNRTGHKLLTGYPEGRRLFANIRVYNGTQLMCEVNPYDTVIGTLKGLSGVASSPALGPRERYEDRLVYEAKGSSTLTGEQSSFHFALITGRSKDNRIPPAGFSLAGAAARLVDPVYNGVSDPGYFTAAEYAGGYDDVTVTGLPTGATSVEVVLYYQTTTREYVEFLRDEINGTGGTLQGSGIGGDPAYLVQTDGFFTHLKAWGNTIWDLWLHNKDVPGAAPIRMASASATVSGAPPNLTYLPLVDTN
ncbi:MAG: hypothetical protein ACYC5O_11015 [Anaerolineae bacterium]